MKLVRTFGAALVALALAAPVAKAQQTIDLTIGASHPATLPWIQLLQQWYQPEVNKRLAAAGNRYRINWREGYGGVLYKANATLTSVGEGIADVGWVFGALEGARLPLQQVSNYAPAVTGDPRLMIDVFNELNDKLPQLQSEWEKANVVFLAATAADTLHLFMKAPVRTFAELKGRKIGAGGTIATLVSGAGAVPVDSPFPSMYNDIKTGVTEGSLTIATGAIGIRAYEVAPYITLADMGSFSSGAIVANRDTWNKLPAEVRTVMAETAREYSKRLGEETMARYDGALKAMVERGKAQTPPVTLIEFPESERAKWIQGLPNLAGDWVKANEARGLKAKEVLSAYMDAMRARGVKPVRNWDR